VNAVVTIDDRVIDKLIDAAQKASTNAYCRYSHFPVGAAVLTVDGDIFTGCNVENASFGLTICAERNAIFHMIAEGQRQIATIVIYTPTPEPPTPCGACRQVINEFGPQAQVIGVCDGPNRLVTSLADLLPHAFGPDDLE
jgi:cytidine deaminase